MQKRKVLVINHTEDVAQRLREALDSSTEFELIDSATDGSSGIKKLLELEPDVCVLDLILPEVDGYKVLETVKLNGLKTKMLILSHLSSDTFVKKAIELGADYFMVKPMNTAVVIDRIAGLFSMPSPQLVGGAYSKRPSAKIEARSIDERVTNIFLSVGIPAHIKGYGYLREAIREAIETPEIVGRITKGLYPAIADKFGTSASKVERAIRHAIEVAWNRGKIEQINSVFGIKIYTTHEKPTNGEFIALIADKLLIEGVDAILPDTAV